jgi:integrase/recombinase XerC
MSSVVNDYMSHLRRRQLAPSSITAYRDILRAYTLAVAVETATTETIERWLDSRRLAARARLTYVSCISGFHQWLSETGRTDTDPGPHLVRPKLPNRLPRPATTKDLARAIECAPTRLRAWICLAAYQGLRCCEIAALRRENLRLDDDPPVIHLTVTKGSKDRVIPLSDETLEALRAYGIPSRGWLFPAHNALDRPVQTLGHIGRNRVSHLLSLYLRNLGIPATAHQFRHWFGTEVYRQTLDLRLVGALLGHADLKTTAGYVALVPSPDAVAIVRALTANPTGGAS